MFGLANMAQVVAPQEAAQQLAQPQAQPLVQAPSPAPSAEPPTPAGMFGIKGTFRDILGTLGDAFLIGSGNNPIYMPVRQQEKRGAALHNFAEDPLAAIERLRAIDPNAAQEMLNDYQKQQHAQQEMGYKEKELGFKQNDDNREQAEYEANTFDRGARMLGTANERNYPQVLEQVRKYFTSRGIEVPVSLPEAYDADAINSIVSMGIDAATQRRLEDADETRALNEQLRREGYSIQRDGLDLRREEADVRRQNTEQDNNRADQEFEERRRRNQRTEGQTDERLRIQRENGGRNRRRTPPAQPKEGDRRTINGKTYEWRNGRPVLVG